MRSFNPFPQFGPKPPRGDESVEITERHFQTSEEVNALLRDAFNQALDMVPATDRDAGMAAFVSMKVTPEEKAGLVEKMEEFARGGKLAPLAGIDFEKVIGILRKA